MINRILNYIDQAISYVESLIADNSELFSYIVYIKSGIRINDIPLLLMGFLTGLVATVLQFIDDYIWHPPQALLVILLMSLIRVILEAYADYRQHKLFKPGYLLYFIAESLGVMVVMAFAFQIGKFDTWNVFSTDGVGIVNGIFLTIGVYYFLTLSKALHRVGIISIPLLNKIINRVEGIEKKFDERTGSAGTQYNQTNENLENKPEKEDK